MGPGNPARLGTRLTRQTRKPCLLPADVAGWFSAGCFYVAQTRLLIVHKGRGRAGPGPVYYADVQTQCPKICVLVQYESGARPGLVVLLLGTVSLRSFADCIGVVDHRPRSRLYRCRACTGHPQRGQSTRMISSINANFGAGYTRGRAYLETRYTQDPGQGGTVYPRRGHALVPHLAPLRCLAARICRSPGWMSQKRKGTTPYL